jgi:hypothetical protein
MKYLYAGLVYILLLMILSIFFLPKFVLDFEFGDAIEEINDLALQALDFLLDI